MRFSWHKHMDSTAGRNITSLENPDPCNYNVIMLTRIVRIGNSRGVRIPKVMLEESGITGDVELIADGEQIVIRAAEGSRSGWEEAFQAMAGNNDDRIPDEEALDGQTSWDEEEWEWE